MDTPLFRPTLDRSRPHELLPEGADPSRCGQLKYRYLDTLETVLVPNLWYNQTMEMRADGYEAQAAAIDKLAAALADQPARLMLPQEARDMLAHYRRQAAAFRAQAARFRGEQLRRVGDCALADARTAVNADSMVAGLAARAVLAGGRSMAGAARI
ncbi:hypothetical protein [Chitinimonas koreensis]|uniref:hypothetical protein n=1 Tax=Chitinimonas koreensis TaxID=356302 RepID=UPI00040F63AE|nr:hypothetical protein [Chitinimonas koreensis]QNM96138.1 hypothetical protein H9L41_20370 [Chitinimonas koreensis]